MCDSPARRFSRLPSTVLAVNTVQHAPDPESGAGPIAAGRAVPHHKDANGWAMPEDGRSAEVDYGARA